MEFKIQLKSLKFHAYHGYYPEESVIGGDYLVDISFTAEAEQAALNDTIEGTIDYVRVYELIKKEMIEPSKLLEHLANRIVERIKDEIPEAKNIELTVYKLKPPIGGEIEHVSVTLKD